jgi:hypothetical protein
MHTRMFLLLLLAVSGCRNNSSPPAPEKQLAASATLPAKSQSTTSVEALSLKSFSAVSITEGEQLSSVLVRAQCAEENGPKACEFIYLRLCGISTQPILCHPQESWQTALSGNDTLITPGPELGSKVRVLAAACVSASRKDAEGRQCGQVFSQELILPPQGTSPGQERLYQSSLRVNTSNAAIAKFREQAQQLLACTSRSKATIESQQQMWDFAQDVVNRPDLYSFLANKAAQNPASFSPDQGSTWYGPIQRAVVTGTLIVGAATALFYSYFKLAKIYSVDIAKNMGVQFGAEVVNTSVDHLQKAGFTPTKIAEAHNQLTTMAKSAEHLTSLSRVGDSLGDVDRLVATVMGKPPGFSLKQVIAAASPLQSQVGAAAKAVSAELSQPQSPASESSKKVVKQAEEIIDTVKVQTQQLDASQTMDKVKAGAAIGGAIVLSTAAALNQSGTLALTGGKKASAEVCFAAFAEAQKELNSALSFTP